MKHKMKVLAVRPRAIAIEKKNGWVIKNQYDGTEIAKGNSEKSAWNNARIILWREISVKRIKVKITFSDDEKKVKKNRNRRIFKRDGFKCVACGCSEIEKLTVDHLYPESKGGTSEEWNLATMCKDCNTKKADKIVQKWVDLMHMQWQRDRETVLNLKDLSAIFKI